MATTALVAEILIIGLETLAWLVPLLAVLIGLPPAPLEAASKVKDWAALVTVLVLAAAYVLGILMDRAADSTYAWLRAVLQRLGLTTDRDLPAPVGEMRLAVTKASEGHSRFLDYQRSRMRIARATVVNLLGGLLVGLFLLYRAPLSRGDVLVAIAAVGLFVVGLTLLATERIHEAWLSRLTEAYLMTRTAPIGDVVVAAVCYKRRSEGLRFLLVRTKGDKYWTFPKGHIKKKERDRPWQAAAREAREEAGAGGSVHEVPFAHYLYPAGGGDTDPPHLIAAHLLEVTRPLGPHEPNRDPRWCTPEEACANLAEGRRERRFVDQMTGVVKSAVRVLDGARADGLTRAGNRA